MWELIWFILKQPITIIKLVVKILTIINSLKDRTMKDFKTTALSILQALVLLGSLFGVQVAPELQTTIITLATSAYAVLGAIKGFFTKDSIPPTAA